MGLVGEDGQPVKSEGSNDEKADQEAAFEAERTEALGRILHESAREAVEKGLVVRDDIPVQPFIEWDALSEKAKAGRLSQARYLIDKAAAEVKSVLYPSEGPKIEIELKPDGRLSILAPPDAKAVLAMLHAAVDEVTIGIARMSVLRALGAAGAPTQGVQKPGLRDVLRFGKR